LFSTSKYFLVVNGQSLITVFIYWSADWGPKIDVVGFCFLDLASNYVPPEPLVKWLEAGDKPIYIGFGSLVRSVDLALYLLPTFFYLDPTNNTA
jgi:hypothetical protein